MQGLKIAICLLLVLSFVALPTIQRVHAVVTVSTLVGVLILTVLAAMGITLVVKDMTKEAFVLDKGDSFMQSKGLSGSFAEWIAGGTDVDVALKTGFLVLAKPVVDRIRQFISWLVPGAASDTVVNIGSGDAVPISEAILTGSFVRQSNGSTVIVLDSFLYPASNFVTELSDGENTLHFTNRYSGYADGKYSVDGTYIPGPFAWNISSSVFLFRNSSSYVDSSGRIYPVGIYLEQGNYALSPGNAIRIYSVSPYIDYNERVFLENSLVTPSVEAGAVIGSYDDLSQLQDTTASDGTVNNTFYISSDGQALNPSSQDIADIIGALQQSLDDINRKLDVMPWTAAAEEAGTVAPDYSDFELGNLNFSSLGALITTRFPFSIPWDMVRIFEVFAADPVPPRWEVDILPIAPFEDVNTTLVLDMGQYPIVGQLSRWFCIIDLCLGLVFVTKRLVWTA